MKSIAAGFVLTLSLAGTGLSPAHAYIPTQEVNVFDDPSILKLVGVESSIPVITLQISPQTSQERFVALTVNKVRKKTMTLTGNTQVIVQLPINQTSTLEAWIYRMDPKSGAVLERKSSEVIVDNTWWGGRKVKLAGLLTEGVVTPGLKNVKIKSATPPPAQLLSTFYAPQTHVKLMVDGKKVHEAYLPLNNTPALPYIPISKGKHKVELMIGNAWGGYQSWNQMVYNFGLPIYGGNYVVLNKETKQAFVIQNYQYKAVFPVGVGAPKTPTPNGIYTLGRLSNVTDPKTKEQTQVLGLLYRGGSTWLNIHTPQAGEVVGQASTKGGLVLAPEALQSLGSMGPGTPLIITSDLGADMLKEPEMPREAAATATPAAGN